MSSIALFPCVSTVDSGIIGELLSISTLKVYTDENLFRDTAAQYRCNSPRLREIMYGRTSLFNQFTLEKEKVIDMFHSILSDKLCGPEQHLFYGFLTSLIPPGQKEVLTVLVVDTKGNRIDRCMHDGLSKNEAKKTIRNHDLSAFCWTDFLFKKDAYDSSLYDLVLPVENRNHRQITKEILSALLWKSCHKKQEMKAANFVDTKLPPRHLSRLISRLSGLVAFTKLRLSACRVRENGLCT